MMNHLHRLALWMHIAVCVALFLGLAGLALVGLSGCQTARPELVTVELPAPPPTIVTRTDTVRVAFAADALAVARDSARAPMGTPARLPAGAVRTQPRRVEVSTVPRAVPTWDVPHFLGLRIDSLDVLLQLASGDYSFAVPAKGETLAVYPRPGGIVQADLTGTPLPERAIVRMPRLKPVPPVVYPPVRVLIGGLILVAGLFAVSNLLAVIRHKG